MLHLLKKLKLSPEIVHNTPVNIQIKIYLWSFVDYQRLQKYFYNWHVTLNYCFIYKIDIRGIRMSFYLEMPQIVANSQICFNNISPTLKKCKWLKTLCTGNANPANIRLDEDVLKTSYVFRRRLQDVLVKTNIFVLAICLQNVFKTSSRRLQEVLKTSSRLPGKISSRRF